MEYRLVLCVVLIGESQDDQCQVTIPLEVERDSPNFTSKALEEDDYIM